MSPSGVRERWYHAQAGESRAHPAVLDDLVYFGTGDGQVIARDRTTGAARWSARVGGDAVEGANLIARNGIVVAPLVRYTVGLDAETGREMWRYTAPPDTGLGSSGFAGQVVQTHIDADDEAAYIPAWGASVSAVNLQTGAVRWVWQPGRSAGDTAAAGLFRSGSMGVRVSGDTVFATVWHNLVANGVRSEPWLVALDRRTGAELWRVVLPSYTGGVLIQGAPAFYQNLVIVTTVGGHAWAIDRTTRQVAWHFTPRTQFTTLAQAEVFGDVVYHDGGDRNLYALRANDGTVLWKSDAENGATRDLLVTERRVYYPTGGTLHVFDRMTGQRVATGRVPRDGDIFESPAAFAGGRVFVTRTDAALSFDEP